MHVASLRVVSHHQGHTGTESLSLRFIPIDNHLKIEGVVQPSPADKKCPSLMLNQLSRPHNGLSIFHFVSSNAEHLQGVVWSQCGSNGWATADVLLHLPNLQQKVAGLSSRTEDRGQSCAEKLSGVLQNLQSPQTADTQGWNTRAVCFLSPCGQGERWHCPKALCKRDTLPQELACI